MKAAVAGPSSTGTFGQGGDQGKQAQQLSQQTLLTLADNAGLPFHQDDQPPYAPPLSWLIVPQSSSVTKTQVITPS